MPSKRSRSYEDLLTDDVAESIWSDGARLAGERGGPAGSRRPTTPELVEMWGLPDPLVDYEALADRLGRGGLSQEEAQQLLIVKKYPDVMSAYLQPQPGQADMLARLAEYPFRPDTYLHLDPEERVGMARSLDRAWRKTFEQTADEATAQDGYAGSEGA